MHLGTLLLVSPLPVVTDGARFLLTKKWIEGALRFQKYWPGGVKALFPPASGASDNLDNVWVTAADLGFPVEVRSLDDPRLTESLAGNGLILGGHYARGFGLAQQCRAVGVPVVYATEYTLLTRLQVLQAAVQGVPRLAKAVAWELNNERAFLLNLRHVAALQCNGLPTYRAYRRFHADRMLYFDSRITPSMFATVEEQRARAQRVLSGEPLHLVFSGRLNAMKGADHLLNVASALKRRGVPFRFSICGDGALAPQMRARIAQEDLPVQMLGVLDFESALMPFVRQQADLFVMCHVQGDPSCTYLETLAAGVPIAGYANEAFAGLLEVVDAGWRVPVGDAEALAAQIASLGRQALLAKGQAGLVFARQHDFERTFEARIQHLIAVHQRATKKVA